MPDFRSVPALRSSLVESEVRLLCPQASPGSLRLSKQWCPLKMHTLRTIPRPDLCSTCLQSQGRARGLTPSRATPMVRYYQKLGVKTARLSL